MRKPDFFIVGAPKCGTTSIYDLLGQHPEIFVPSVKEIHFFGTDLYAPGFTRDVDSYLQLFQNANDEKRVGEASVWYLYSKRSASEINQFSPRASIIIMLRNPVEMVYSLHSQRLYIGTEDIADFKEALNAEGDRRKGLRLPRDPYPVEGLFYREVGLYSQQVRRYLEAFSATRVKVVIYDDFLADPIKIYRELLEFLGVATSFQPEIKKLNSNKFVRSKIVRRILDRPPLVGRKLARPFTSPEIRRRFLQTLRELNTVYAPRPPLSASIRSHLQDHFAPDVEQLGELLGRDLSHWCSSSAGES